MTEQEHNKNVIRLLPRRKKGVLRIIFSRVFLLILLTLVQIVMLHLGISYFTEKNPILMVFQVLFSVMMILYLFNSDMDSSAKLTWLWIIMLFPYIGTVFLWITTVDVGQRALKKRISVLNDESKNALKQKESVLQKSDIVGSGTDDLCRYLGKTGCFPLYDCTEVTYLPSGEAYFDALLAALKQAKSFVYLEYFILDEGYMWGSVLSVLAEKVKQGLDVRVMYDGMCEISSLSFDYPERMQALGISCKAFTKIRPFLSTNYNYRDHRKIAVIDGEIAFNGGINLADEYINRRMRFGHWKDAALMMRGEAVRSFTLMFMQMWNITEPETDWTPLSHPTLSAGTDGFVMPFADHPLDDDKVGENIYMDMLNRATRYVHIMTPYLILDDELESAIRFAAERGVDVRLILPGVPDKKTAFALAKSHYRRLTQSGVKIYEYTPGFVHAKVCVSDDCKAVVGTINFDYRSLYHHFECATYLYRCACIADIEQDFLNTMKNAAAVTPETIKNEKRRYKLLGGFLKIFAPLM